MPSAPPRSRRVPTLLTTLVAVTSLLLASCSGDEDEKEAARKAAEREQVTRSPLTGLPVKGKVPGHPVVAVKIDNSSSSAPQVGLGAAELVAEELVEGGITRLAAFFYADVPGNVGPVRSMRATDIGIVQPLDAVLVASGGAAPTVTRLKDAGIRTFTEGAAGYYRDSGRSAPYNLFMRLGELAKTLDDGNPPAPYLPFAESPSLPKGQPAKGFTAAFSPSSSSTFELRDGRYVNTDTFAAAEDQFVADSVLVLRVRVEDAGYRDPAGNFVPETVFDGEGEAMIFNDGRLVRGTWAKDGLASDIRLRAGGKTVTLPPGKVWIELVPAEGGSVTVTK
jgi:Protein of unknown function (DUF3048) N-terminal domain/Protein of unknown function (DUF3048) C-terminal domain